MHWERSAIEAAAAYLRDMIDAGANDVRTRGVHDGLLDILDPTRHATRIQRTASADISAIIYGMRERRARIERRGHTERRLVNLGPGAAGERREGIDRRRGTERRRP